ncbi:MAG: hypothetical protein PHV39_05040 [Methanomicrobium sp.]|nr:hypothetical protein [Methanomicrobium sp.]
MDKKISNPVKVLAIVAAVITLVLVNLMIFAAPQYESNYVFSVEESRLDWFSGFGMYSTYPRSPDPELVSPTVVYYSENDTFQLQNPEKWCESIYVGDYFSSDLSSPELYEDLWHTPDISIDGNNLSFDYSVYNGAGIDCQKALYNVTLTVIKVNLSTDYYQEEVAGEIPVEDIEVTDLSAGEYREYRITADLFKPKPGEIYELVLKIYSPAYFIDYNDTKITMSEICNKCEMDRIPRNTIYFVLKASDAPDIPKITCENGYMCPDVP